MTRFLHRLCGPRCYSRYLFDQMPMRLTRSLGWVRKPKMVINNIDVLRNAFLTDDSIVSASMYHDRLLWRLIALGVNERRLPVIILISDSCCNGIWT
ncbi:uncharacterized protein LOC122094130 isoform X2 [Macadamia integrifolia]|uniref:uncharacterized protein LOC122094130 isoform X2 n=1 Tax=Macadamia integrifolia TaxID=60698 RepID=UPI001C52AFCA|nr:uncharacterized protein LOC122094130 isoform X2 [Macadamia integrifolia]